MSGYLQGNKTGPQLVPAAGTIVQSATGQLMQIGGQPGGQMGIGQPIRKTDDRGSANYVVVYSIKLSKHYSRSSNNQSK